MLDMMTQQYGIVFPEGLHEVKNKMVEDLYRAELKIVDGVQDVLSQLKARGLSISIGSNSPKRRVALAVQLTGIADCFDRIVSYEDVRQGKPAPDIFLAAAQLAGVAIAECVVVEDSITGVTAAKAARNSHHWLYWNTRPPYGARQEFEDRRCPGRDRKNGRPHSPFVKRGLTSLGVAPICRRSASCWPLRIT